MRLADRRRAVRFEIVGTLRGAIENAEVMRVRNVGRYGALVESRSALAVGSRQVLRLVQGGEEDRLEAEVRHLTPVADPGAERRYVVGLKFLNLDERVMLRIDRMVSEGAAAGGSE